MTLFVNQRFAEGSVDVAAFMHVEAGTEMEVRVLTDGTFSLTLKKGLTSASLFLLPADLERLAEKVEELREFERLRREIEAQAGAVDEEDFMGQTVDVFA